ncbi:hypothetical protein [Actinacidiphila soli]|nr:hypothetical protein [Actinacidiphila soli]
MDASLGGGGDGDAPLTVARSVVLAKDSVLALRLAADPPPATAPGCG